MSDPFSISVVIPNRNHGQYLIEQLEAISFQSPSALEVLVYDDASTDDSRIALRSWMEKNPKVPVHVFFGEYPIGCVAAMNYLIRKARGQYVATLAADDKVEKNFFLLVSDMAKKYPQAGVISGLVKTIDLESVVTGFLKTPILSSGDNFISPVEVEELLIKYGNWICSVGAIIKKSAIEDLGYYDACLGSYSDGLFIQAVALHYGAVFIRHPVAFWRQSQGGWSVLTNKDTELSRQLVKLVAGQMRTGFLKPFPPKYVERWLNLQKYRIALEELKKEYCKLFHAEDGKIINLIGAILIFLKSITKAISPMTIRAVISHSFIKRIY